MKGLANIFTSIKLVMCSGEVLNKVAGNIYIGIKMQILSDSQFQYTLTIVNLIRLVTCAHFNHVR